MLPQEFFSFSHIYQTSSWCFFTHKKSFEKTNELYAVSVNKPQALTMIMTLEYNHEKLIWMLFPRKYVWMLLEWRNTMPTTINMLYNFVHELPDILDRCSFLLSGLFSFKPLFTNWDHLSLTREGSGFIPTVLHLLIQSWRFAPLAYKHLLVFIHLGPWPAVHVRTSSFNLGALGLPLKPYSSRHCRSGQLEVSFTTAFSQMATPFGKFISM